jgi:hypothetical protein
MLSTTHTDTNTATAKSKWISKFRETARAIPHRILHKKGYPIPKAKSNTNTTTNHLYQIIFDQILNIQIPTVVLQKASKRNESIGCRLHITLFDLESGTFFGKTWQAKELIPIASKLNNAEDHQDSSDESSDSSDKSIDSKRANLIGNKLVLQLSNQVL